MPGSDGLGGSDGWHGRCQSLLSVLCQTGALALNCISSHNDWIQVMGGGTRRRSTCRLQVLRLMSQGRPLCVPVHACVCVCVYTRMCRCLVATQEAGLGGHSPCHLRPVGSILLRLWAVGSPCRGAESWEDGCGLGRHVSNLDLLVSIMKKTCCFSWVITSDFLDSSSVLFTLP